jgi:hypothetical protein
MKKKVSNLVLALSLILMAGYSFSTPIEVAEAQAGTSTVNCVKTSGSGGENIGGFIKKRDCNAKGCAWADVSGTADTCVIKNTISIE